MRKWFTLVLLGLVAGLTVGVLSLQAADTIKIGFTPPITGASADEGALADQSDQARRETDQRSRRG